MNCRNNGGSEEMNGNRKEEQQWFIFEERNMENEAIDCIKEKYCEKDINSVNNSTCSLQTVRKMTENYTLIQDIIKSTLLSFSSPFQFCLSVNRPYFTSSTFFQHKQK